MDEDTQQTGCLYLINTTTTPKPRETMERSVVLIDIIYLKYGNRI
jgi:hypothetical protein